jgi:hypothetical protein
MGADLLVTALVIDQGRRPDFAAARAAIDSVGPAEIEDPDEFWELDPETSDGLDAIRSQLRDALNELEAALQWSRELASFNLRGATVHLTGGMSWGDSPTRLSETFSRLWAVPAVLVAAGFEGLR